MQSFWHLLRQGLRLTLMATILALPIACAGDKDLSELAYEEEPVEDLFGRAQQFMAAQKYREAARLFNEVERQHPYSTLATKSQLLAAYAYYEYDSYDEAVVALERFINLHPNHEDIAYAYYLKALCYYERISDIGRDQKMTLDAMQALQDIIRRFPDSDYAKDARLKYDLTKDHLAGKEMEIGRYYQKSGQYLAAINRFRTVIEEYQTTSHVAEALHRLTESYLALGLPQEAQTAAAVLGYNFPGSKWYQYSYTLLTGQNLEPLENEKSWISRAFHAIF